MLARVCQLLCDGTTFAGARLCHALGPDFSVRVVNAWLAGLPPDTRADAMLVLERLFVELYTDAAATGGGSIAAAVRAPVVREAQGLLWRLVVDGALPEGERLRLLALRGAPTDGDAVRAIEADGGA